MYQAFRFISPSLEEQRDHDGMGRYRGSTTCNYLETKAVAAFVRHLGGAV